MPGNTPANVDGTGSNPEAAGLQNYDWADRIRHKANVRATVIPVEAFTFGLVGQYQEDEFGGDSRFGLKKQEVAVGGVDLSYAPLERISLYASYSKEYRKGAMQSGAKDDTFDAPGTLDDTLVTDNFNPFNYWNTDIYEKVDTIGIGANLQVIPNRLTVGASYNLSLSKMDFKNVNPNGAVKLDNAQVEPWSTVRSRLQEVRADIAYHFAKNLKVGVNYLYEWYKLDDFANTPAYMAGASVENSTRFVFTGATHYSYDAHVAGAYLNYKF